MRALSTLLILSVAILFAAGLIIPSSFAMVIQGHSPINILVTDPNGNQTGCLNGNNFTNIPTSTYNGCGSTPQTVTIAEPTPGVYTVQWFSTLSGTEQGQFSITVTSCPQDNSDSSNSGHFEQACAPTDPDDTSTTTATIVTETSITGSASGSVTFTLNNDGSISQTPTTGVPEFPGFASAAIAALGIFSLFLVLRAKRRIV